MASKGQYLARHKETGIEVQVTYPRKFEVEEQEALQKVIGAFAHFLGELEGDTGTQRAAMFGVGSLLERVRIMKRMLQRTGQFAVVLEVSSGENKGKTKFQHNFSDN